jgi:hypothetical protein
MGKLQALGLTENECKAYLILLKLGVCTAVQISRESHLQRTEIYPLMAGLVSKGLVEETVDRPKRYRPVNVKHALPCFAVKIRSRVDAIARFAEVRHTDSPIGFSMGIADDTDAAIYYMDPDSPELESRTDYMIRITSKQGMRHLGNLFEALWQESASIEELLQRDPKPASESSNPPG